jgi:hypothetical protein
MHHLLYTIICPRILAVIFEDRAKGCLVRLAKTLERHSAGPEFDSPWERIFGLWLKKSPRRSRVPKYWWSPGPGSRSKFPRGYGTRYQGGAGVRGFSRSGKPSFFFKKIPVGAVFPHPAEFFFIIWNWRD